MSSLPAYFGPIDGIDSKDYLFMMQGQYPTDAPQSLLGHTLTSPSTELSDALTVTRVELSRGRIRTVVRTKRAPEIRGRSYTIGFPAGALWTPAMQATLRQGCRNTFYMKYLCPDDSRYNHAEIFPDGLLDPLQEEGDLITVDEENVLGFTSTLNISDKLRLWGIGFEIINTVDSTELHDVQFTTADCPLCSDIPGLGMIVVGGDGTAIPTALLTDDRFATAATTLTTGGVLTQYGVALYTDGALVVVGTSDVPAGGAAGSLHVSADTGASFTNIASVTAPINGIAGSGSTVVAVGGDTGAPAEVHYSVDRGVSFTASTSSNLPATSALNDVAFDRWGERYFAAGEDGTLLVMRFSGTALTITDISSNLPGTPGDLFAVAVLGENYVAVGGAAGYYAESFDGGVTWREPSVPGSAAVTSIAGNSYRTIVASGTNLYERTILSDYLFVQVELLNGQTVTGNYTKVSMNVDDDFNLFVAVTDDGEVVLGKPFYPNA